MMALDESAQRQDERESTPSSMLAALLPIGSAPTAEVPSGSDLRQASLFIVNHVVRSLDLPLEHIEQHGVAHGPKWATVAVRLGGERFVRVSCEPPLAAGIVEHVMKAPPGEVDGYTVRTALTRVADDIARHVEWVKHPSWPSTDEPPPRDHARPQKYSTVCRLHYAWQGALLEVALLCRSSRG
jgi:hypothetical protein